MKISLQPLATSVPQLSLLAHRHRAGKPNSAASDSALKTGH
jgi:hypothetical protein